MSEDWDPEYDYDAEDYGDTLEEIVASRPADHDGIPLAELRALLGLPPDA